MLTSKFAYTNIQNDVFDGYFFMENQFDYTKYDWSGSTSPILTLNHTWASTKFEPVLIVTEDAQRAQTTQPGEPVKVSGKAFCFENM